MNYYENMEENVFVPLDCIEEFKGLYEINKLGHIKTKSSGKIRTSFGKDKNGYPTVTLVNFKTGVKRSYGLHVLLAKTFIPNPDNKPIVYHVIPGKENRGNYKLSNLRWATYSENNKNKIVTSRQNILYAKLDSNGNEIKRFKMSDLSKDELNSIRASIRRKGTHRSFYWKRIDLSVESYINKFGKPYEQDWKVCLRDPYFECNKNGLIRIKKTKILTIGTNQGGYRAIHHGKTRYLVHRLICETFLGRLLKEDEVVDHISTDITDNRFSNLRVGTQKDNMNNPLTIQYRQKPVLQYAYNGKLLNKFKSAKDAAEIFNKNEHAFRETIRHRQTAYGYLWCYEGEEEFIKQKLKRLIFKYDKNFDLIKSFRSLRSAEKESTCSRNAIAKYLDSGKPCTDGFYYYKGPRDGQG